MAMQFNLNNKGNNIHKANQSKPNHSYKDIEAQNHNKQIAKAQKKLPTTTMKVDLPTLHKISALQTLLTKNTRTQTLHDLISNVVIPTLIKDQKINKDTFDKVYSVEKLKK